MSIDCDCGTCCDQCGHADDCLIVILSRPSPSDDYDHDAYTL